MTLVLGVCEAQTKSIIWISWTGFIRGYRRKSERKGCAGAGAVPALRRRLSSSLSDPLLSRPSPSSSHGIPSRLSPGLPLPSLSTEPPAVLHVDHTPQTLSGTSDSTKAPPGPITAPSSVSAAALCSLAARSCRHPGTQQSSLGLCWRAPAGARCPRPSLFCLWLPAFPPRCAVATVQAPAARPSCLLPAWSLCLWSRAPSRLTSHLPAQCVQRGGSVSRVPSTAPPPQLCARVTQAHVWLPGSVDTEAVRLKRFVSSIHERYRGMDRAGAETASDPRAALSSRPPWGRGRLRLVLLPLWSQAGDLRSLDPLCR